MIIFFVIVVFVFRRKLPFLLHKILFFFFFIFIIFHLLLHTTYTSRRRRAMMKIFWEMSEKFSGNFFSSSSSPRCFCSLFSHFHTLKLSLLTHSRDDFFFVIIFSLTHSHIFFYSLFFDHVLLIHHGENA